MEKNQSITGALKKAKRKQLFKTIITSVIVVLILLPVLYQTGNYFAGNSTMKLHDKLNLLHAISEPNVEIDSQVSTNHSIFGGNIVTHRSKNLNGYMVQWSTLTSSYDLFGSEIDANEMIPAFYSAGKKYIEYDKQTKKKVAKFYHPSFKKYFDGVQNELTEIAQMENHVAEVAVSFDKPCTYEEIQVKIPDNLNIVWLYMTSQIKDESHGPSGLPVYGFGITRLQDSPKAAYKDFVKALEEYDRDGKIEPIQKFLKENKGKKFADVKILGVMLTGQTQNFKALEGADFIRGASIGATAPIVPYILPER